MVGTVNWLGRFYQWFWFATEFWLTPIDRRPYTFIMRDWLYNHPKWFTVIIIVWFGLDFVWVVSHPLLALIVGIFSALLLAHLVWGTKWIEGQQESETYLGGTGYEYNNRQN